MEDEEQEQEQDDDNESSGSQRTYFGTPEENCKCRFCNKSPEIFKVGSLETQGGYVVSWRVFLLCEDHKDEKHFERPMV